MAMFETDKAGERPKDRLLILTIAAILKKLLKLMDYLVNDAYKVRSLLL